MNKNKENKGFTLAETLVTVLIVILVSIVLTTLITLANSAFTKTLKESDGQMLASTLTNAIEDEFRYATNIKTSTDGFTYFSTSSGLGSNCKLVSKSETYKGIERNVLVIEGEGGDYPLVNYGAYVYGLGANLTTEYKVNENVVWVTLDIVDTNNKVICSNEFGVVPLNLDKLN